MRSDGHSTGGASVRAKIGRAKNAPTKTSRAKTVRAKHQLRRALNRGETPRRRQVKRALPAFHFKGASLAERLRAHVVVDPETGCHVWTSTLAKGGYGRVLVSAHRLAWELAHGPIPEGMLVLHKCDNPPCCTPAPSRPHSPCRLRRTGPFLPRERFQPLRNRRRGLGWLRRQPGLKLIQHFDAVGRAPAGAQVIASLGVVAVGLVAAVVSDRGEGSGLQAMRRVEVERLAADNVVEGLGPADGVGEVVEDKIG